MNELPNFWTNKSILVTGGNGFLGHHVVDSLIDAGASKSNIRCPRSVDFDLTKSDQAAGAIDGADIVIHLAAVMGGIGFFKGKNGRVFHDNLSMGLNVLEQSRLAGVQKVAVIGTNCSYPANASVPTKETELWRGYPASETAAYGISKLSVFEHAAFLHEESDLQTVNLIPTNLYGPGDNFDPATALVIPGLIAKYEHALRTGAPSVKPWGTGQQSRDFLYVGDVANAIVESVAIVDDPGPINLGSSIETKIRDVAASISETVGFPGDTIWDASGPVGRARGALDISRAKELFGFNPTTTLADGIRQTVDWYRENNAPDTNERSTQEELV
jgi:GDP-L-fucose synthase